MELRYYQKEAIESAWNHLNSKPGNPCIVLPTGCHAKDHPVLMYDGSVKAIQGIAVGEKIMGPDSKPRTVMQLCQGREEMFQITPIKGESFVVNGGHLLSLECTNEGKKAGNFACYRKGGEIDNITVSEYVGKSKSWKHLRKLYRVAVDFPGSNNLPIPPYVLGALIGDGYINGSITITKDDPELLREIEDYAISLGCKFTKKTGSDYDWRISVDRGTSNPFVGLLKNVGLYGHASDSKFVPKQYLTSSRENRLEILAGLIDSDGCLSHSGFDFISKSEQLTNNVVFLARSLGLAAYVNGSLKVQRTEE